MRTTLLVSAVAFLLTYSWLLLVRVRSLRVAEEVERLHREARIP
jgi:hypothetical protein